MLLAFGRQLKQNRAAICVVRYASDQSLALQPVNDRGNVAGCYSKRPSEITHPHPRLLGIVHDPSTPTPASAPTRRAYPSLLNVVHDHEDPRAWKRDGAQCGVGFFRAKTPSGFKSLRGREKRLGELRR